MKEQDRVSGGADQRVYDRICELAASYEADLIRMRRELHRFPETGWLEMRTSARIAKELTELGYEVLTGKAVCRADARVGVPPEEELAAHAARALSEEGAEEIRDFLTEEMQQGFTGVIGILHCGPGPEAALRFDIDALPMTEAADEGHRPYRDGFASVHPGMMHACGHDCHTAIGLGTARVLQEIKEKLHGTVRLIFQPAEEGTRGAGAVTAAGHLDSADYLIGTHVAPAGGSDDGDLTPGSHGSLATSKYKVYFHGQAAHAGGFPEQGRSAVLAAAHAVIGLSGISRHGGGATRVNVGHIEGGTGTNVVADEAEISMEVRGADTAINDYMDKRAQEVCMAAAAMEGCTCEMELMGHAPSQRSDEALINRIGDMAEQYLPELRVSTCRDAKNYASEDIGFMMERVQQHGGQAVYMRSVTEMASPQHTVRFDVDEAVLRKGVISFAAVLYNLLG